MSTTAALAGIDGALLSRRTFEKRLTLSQKPGRAAEGPGSLSRVGFGHPSKASSAKSVMRIPQYSASQFAASFDTGAGRDDEFGLDPLGLLSPCAGIVTTFEVRGGIATTTPPGLRVGIVMTAGEILARIVYKFFSSKLITVLPLLLDSHLVAISSSSTSMAGDCIIVVWFWCK